jgi:outer membrane protein insertion porin family
MNSFKILIRRAALAVVLATVPIVGAGVGPFAAGAAYADVVSTIVVKGNVRIEAGTIKNYVVIKPGKPYSPAAIDQSVKALFDTGLFSDVTIDRQGSALVVKVVENPIVNTVILHGNHKIKNDVLVPLLTLHARDVLTDAKLKSDAQRLRDYYSSQGRSEATVDPQVTKLPDNRVDVAFQIHEGGRTGIGTIRFIGNHSYSGYRLRQVVISRQHDFLSWLNHKDVFDEARLDGDQEALRRFYMSHGFADFRVVSVDHTFDEARGRYTVVFTVEEGERYHYGAVNIDSSLPGVNTAQLRPLVRTHQGETFNADQVQKTIENISIALSRGGFAFAQVRPRGDRDYDKHSVAITYLIDEGPRVYIERINIVGNTKTRDYVIRREFDVAEGDPYNRAMMDRAERKLRDLGYFKSVHITTEPGSAPDKVIVNVAVEDQSTGDVSLGAGISTRGLIAEVGLNEKNFLGRGQQLGISVGYGQSQHEYNISFTDPYFLGQHISFGVNAYQNQYNSITQRPFDETVNGGGVTFGFPITDDFTFQVNYKISSDQISNTATKSALYFPNGSTLTSSVGYALLYSTLDSTTDPHNGFNFVFTQDFAGVGGDTHYMRSIADAQYYHEIIADSDVIGLVRVTGGNVSGFGQPVRILDNFFKGGETVRGFASYGYGPVEYNSDGTTTPIGGKNYWASTAEVDFPLPGVPTDLGFKGAVFADAGSLWGFDKPAGATNKTADDNVIRTSAGFGLIWASPIGLLRADFADAITKASTDTTEWFRFSAGKRF